VPLVLWLALALCLALSFLALLDLPYLFLFYFYFKQNPQNNRLARGEHFSIACKLSNLYHNINSIPYFQRLTTSGGIVSEV
jgi:hypothetical protein